MEPVEILLKIVLPVGVVIFIFLKKREIANLLSDFRTEKAMARREVSVDTLIEKMDEILRYRYVDRP